MILACLEGKLFFFSVCRLCSFQNAINLNVAWSYQILIILHYILHYHHLQQGPGREDKFVICALCYLPQMSKVFKSFLSMQHKQIWKPWALQCFSSKCRQISESCLGQVMFGNLVCHVCWYKGKVDFTNKINPCFFIQEINGFFLCCKHMFKICS